MQQNPTSKKDMIDFIRENLYPQPNDLNELSSLRQIKNLLERVIRERRDGIVHDEWADDDILGIAQEYLDELPEQRLANEEGNIAFTKGVSLATRDTRYPDELTYKLPEEMKQKIMSYGVKNPYNPKPEFEIIQRFGGKSKRKSRRNNRNTRKHRK